MSSFLRLSTLGIFRFATVMGIAALLLTSHTAFAIETKSWTWAELVEKTAQSNEELKASERQYFATGYRVEGAYAPYFPQISAGVSADQKNGAGREYAVFLNASQNLFAGFQDQGKISEARARHEIAHAQLQSTKAKVSYDLKATVAQLIYAQSAVSLSQSILRRRELNLRMVQLRFDGGRENKGSVLLSKAYLEEARLEGLQAEQALSVAQEQLLKVLGEDSTFIPLLKDKVPVVVPPEEKEINLQELVTQSPPYLMAVAQERVSRAEVTQARAPFFPSVNLTASTSQWGPTWYPDQDRWSVGASLSLPLFNGGRDYFATRSALESLKSSLFSKGSIQKDQLVRLKSAYTTYVQAVQRLKVDESFVEAMEVREKISRQKYNNGLSSFDDWDIIESELIKRQKNLLTSERERISAEAAWEQAQGRGVLP